VNVVDAVNEVCPGLNDTKLGAVPTDDTTDGDELITGVVTNV